MKLNGVSRGMVMVSIKEKKFGDEWNFENANLQFQTKVFELFKKRKKDIYTLSKKFSFNDSNLYTVVRQKFIYFLQQAKLLLNYINL